jgi:hypothetical protein
MQLDAGNANADVSRVIAYVAAPSIFGGSKENAITLLKKAVSLDPPPDSPETARICLALAYDAQGQNQWWCHAARYSRKELREAFATAGLGDLTFIRFPSRYFWQSVSNQVVLAKFGSGMQ